MNRNLLAPACTIVALTAASLTITPALAVPQVPASTPSRPVLSTTVIAEAEEFKTDGSRDGWKAGAWGENYYAGTLANTFLSRKAFLGAPEQANNATASREIEVPAAGRYLALVRYEAAPRFETRFTLRIEQNGKVWEHLYGARDNLKIWAFGQKLKKEVIWDWGANEDIVWEGHDAGVDLQAGRAKLTLIAAPQPAPAARRNVDLVMLTRDVQQVANRIDKEGYLPLDGMLTQAGDLYLKVRNRGAAALSVVVNPGVEHSSYWIHLRDWKPKAIEVPVGQASDWVEVGSLLDTLNDGQWKIDARNAASSATSRLNYDLDFGVPRGRSFKTFKRFNGLTAPARLAYFADTRYQPRVIEERDVLFSLLDYLKKRPVRGVGPQRSLIYGYTFDSHPDDAEYEKARQEFVRLMGVNGLIDEKLSASTKNATGYLDLRSIPNSDNLQAVGKYLKRLGDDGLASKIAVVSTGDEISLPEPSAKDAAPFHAWLQDRALTPHDLDPAATSWDQIGWDVSAGARKTKAGLYFWSNRYAHDYGIARVKEQTDSIKRYLPQAQIGANYSPHHGVYYIGEAHKWARIFREGGMTMPWSEDYLWQVPVASQQVNLLNIDLFRAGIKNKPDDKIQMYVMPHTPGNVPDSWRRAFYGDIAHGAKIFNLFEFRPVQAAYTENHVSSPAMYQEIRRSLHELGPIEDIVQDGRVRGAQVGLWCGETGDIWNDNDGSFGAGKRTLYLAIRHQQASLDMILEEDAQDGTLNNYKVLYLTDRHVSRAASRVLADWVEKGGILLATAGAGMQDEYDGPNVTMRELLGIAAEELTQSAATIALEKQDLPFAAALQTVAPDTNLNIATSAYGAISKVVPAQDAVVLAHFQQNSPAVLLHTVGAGKTYYCGFLPGLSYFKPALPQRPLDRGGPMAHLIPNHFDESAARLVGLPLEGLTRFVSVSNPLVENTVIESPHGSLLMLVNWSGAPCKNLRVTLPASLAFRQVALASGAKVKITRQAGETIATLDLDVADAIVLR